jgi:hypothetical protein
LVAANPAPVVTVEPAPTAQPVVAAPATSATVVPAPEAKPSAAAAEDVSNPAAPAPSVAQPVSVLAAPSPAVTDESTPGAPPAPATAAADTVTLRKWPLILGIGCFWVAIMVALVLARRARRNAPTSYITRSIDREMK